MRKINMSRILLIVLLLASATIPAFSARLFIDGETADSVIVYDKDGTRVEDNRISTNGLEESWLVHAVRPTRLVSENLNFRVSMTAGSTVAFSRFSSNKLDLYVLEGTIRARTSNNPMVAITVFTPVSLFTAQAPAEFMVATMDDEEWIYTFTGEVTAFNSITGTLTDLHDMTFLDMIPGPEEYYGSGPMVVPLSPDVPDEPATPVSPDVPDEPATPVSPDVPDEPATPVSPDVPDEPATPVSPDVPDEPATPVSPDVPVVHGTPVAPEFSSTIQVEFYTSEDPDSGTTSIIAPPDIPVFSSIIGVDVIIPEPISEPPTVPEPPTLPEPPTVIIVPDAPQFSDGIKTDFLPPPVPLFASTISVEIMKTTPDTPEFSTSPSVTLLVAPTPEFSSTATWNVVPARPSTPEFSWSEVTLNAPATRPPAPEFSLSEITSNVPPAPVFSDDSTVIDNRLNTETVGTDAPVSSGSSSSPVVVPQTGAAAILRGDAPAPSFIWGVDSVLSGFHQVENGKSGMSLALIPYFITNGFRLGLRADVSLVFDSPLSWGGNVVDFDTSSPLSIGASVLRFIDHISYGSRYNGFFINADGSSFQGRDHLTVMSAYDPKFSSGKILPLRQAYNSNLIAQELYIDDLYGTSLVGGGFQAAMLRFALKPSSSFAIGFSGVMGLRMTGGTLSDMPLFPAMDVSFTLQDTRDLFLGLSLTLGTYVDALNPSSSTIYVGTGSGFEDKFPNALLSVRLDTRIADSTRASLFVAYNHGEPSTDRFNSTSFSGIPLTSGSDTIVIGGDILLSLGVFSLSADYTLPFEAQGFALATLNPALPNVDSTRKADRGSIGLSINLKSWILGVGMSHISVIDSWKALFSSSSGIESFLNPVYAAWYAEGGYDNGTFGIRARAEVRQDDTSPIGISPLLTLSGVLHVGNK
ncbi:hypothetical protein [Parasphaerochaeta coccoides]|uniref:FecR protein domain-containing protein n=1 Tax=Parasphaerochaeta coccoides (strain ATCC BAA-1237 / DSM 17374 / SPN1) TaxID=760011 RepID=F4GIC7_PARC1|nr:hypothetical protein [Parasphaerochaeta coccoides]AEC01635.1 hypothetical protein Spico_0406 [Parasphaerochaeta coccoides DSM 17374]